ncbi:MAG: hypothetical protein WBP55_01240, partial [Solirubrobacterales bacterium]
VGLISLVSALISLVNAKLGFLTGTAALAAWMAVVVSVPGAALVILLAGILPTIFIRGSGRPLAFGPLGPLLGTLGLAPFLPILAAFASDWRDRAIVAGMGVTFTALAEAITGQKLLFGQFPEAGAGWQNSVSSAVTELLAPTLATSTFLISMVVWVASAVFIGMIISRARARREVRTERPITFTAVGSVREPSPH